MASQALTTMNNIFSKKIEAQERDEYTIFGEQIAVKLRKLSSDRVRSIVQYKMNSLMFEAEMGKFDDESVIKHSQQQVNTRNASASYTPLRQHSSMYYNENPYSRTFSEPPPSPANSITNDGNTLLWNSLPSSPATDNFNNFPNLHTNTQY